MTNAPSVLHTDPTPPLEGKMRTPDGQVIHWERSGNPNGVPVVFLHGGPGSGIAPWSRYLFDPKKYDIVLFDQRGSGKSTPHASESLINNDTPHLVADMEQLRRELGIEKWVVTGGSWGSTLGMSYADKHAVSMLGLVIYGSF